jgi:Ca2+-transporting ATPase
MTVTKIWHFDEPTPVEITQKQGASTLDPATRTILRIGNIVNHGRLLGGESNSTASASVLSSTLGDDASHAKSRWIGQPTDVALLDLLDAFNEDDVRARIGTRRFETPFSSERKWMGVVINGSESSGGSDVAYAKGALEQILKKCDTYRNADGQEIVLDENRRKEALMAAEAMALEGLRVLGFASGPIRQNRIASSLRSQSGRSTPSSTPSLMSPNKPFVPKDEDVYQGLAFAGLVGMNDPPRKGVERSIRRLMAGNVRVIMITGDAETTAVAIGKKLGMPIMNSSLGHSVLRGDQIDRMTEQELSQAIATTTIFARTSPDHKLKIVKALQARGDVVAMTGDGVNDAPALKKADIGISMGLLGTDVAKEAADMILTHDDFSTILNAIEEGKGIFYNIQNFLTFQLSTSAAALSLVLLSTVFGFKNPLNAMQILWISKSPLNGPFSNSKVLTKFRHPHGWSSRPVSWCRTRGSCGDEPPTATSQCTRSHQTSPPTCSSILQHNHAWHTCCVRSRNGRRPPSYCARHYHDIYLLCALRHVQRVNVPLRRQVVAARRNRSVRQQDVQLCRVW